MTAQATSLRFRLRERTAVEKSQALGPLAADELHAHGGAVLVADDNIYGMASAEGRLDYRNAQVLAGLKQCGRLVKMYGHATPTGGGNASQLLAGMVECQGTFRNFKADKLASVFSHRRT
jgi:hypothetical protein